MTTVTRVWPGATHQRPASRARDHSGPIWGHYPGSSQPPPGCNYTLVQLSNILNEKFSDQTRPAQLAAAPTDWDRLRNWDCRRQVARAGPGGGPDTWSHLTHITDHYIWAGVGDHQGWNKLMSQLFLLSSREARNHTQCHWIIKIQILMHILFSQKIAKFWNSIKV